MKPVESFVLVLVGCLALCGVARADAPREVEVRVRQTSGGPQIFVDGSPVAPHMFWARNTTVKRPVSSAWRTFDIAVTPCVDIASAYVCLRLEEEAGLVQVRNAAFVKGTEAQRLLPDLSSVPQFKPFVTTTADATTIDLRSFKGRETKLPALDFRLRTTGARLKRGETYHLRLEARAEGIDWIRLCMSQGEQGVYNFWLMEIPPDDYTLLSNWQQAHKAGRAGARFVTFGAPVCWRPEAEAEAALAALDKDMDIYIDANPNVLLIPRISLNVPGWWTSTHREECMVMENGKTIAFPSVCSKVYQRDAVAYVRRVIRHLRSKYPRHFAGVQFAGQNTHEWFYQDSWTSLSGYDRPTLEAWRRYLAERGAPDAATATVPTPAERRAAKMPMRLWDPVRDRRILDFNQFLQDAMVDLVILINKTCREETEGKKMVFSFYGYGWEFASVNAGPAATGHYGLMRLLEKGGAFIDVMAAPYSYDRRGRGWLGSTAVMPAAETIAAHGILWVNEDDTRTHLNHSRVGNCGIFKAENLGQTMDILRRDTLANAVRGQGSWWMDLVGNGWFDDEILWQIIASFRPEDERLLAHRKPFRPDIACLLDETSMQNLPQRGCAVSVPLLRETRVDLPHVGASWGQFLLSDALAREIGAVLELYLACWHLTDAQVATLVRRQAERAEVSRVWCWNSGYSGPSGFSCDRVRAVTGFAVRERPEAAMRVRATPLGLAAGWPADWNVPLVKNRDEFGLKPCLAIEATPEETLAVWPDGSPAVAWRKNAKGAGWNVLVGVPHLPSAFVRTLAEKAGAHLWYPREQMNAFTLNASDDLMWIQAHTNVTGRLSFPASVSALDAFTGEDLGSVASREVTFRTGEVRGFHLNQKGNAK